MAHCQIGWSDSGPEDDNAGERNYQNCKSPTHLKLPLRRCRLHQDAGHIKLVSGFVGCLAISVGLMLVLESKLPRDNLCGRRFRADHSTRRCRDRLPAHLDPMARTKGSFWNRANCGETDFLFLIMSCLLEENIKVLCVAVAYSATFIFLANGAIEKAPNEAGLLCLSE